MEEAWLIKVKKKINQQHKNCMERTKRIMLVDDEPINNFITEKIIQRYSDYCAEAYTSAREALSRLRNGATPEFIFLDINMPETNGWDFLDEYSTFPDEILEASPVVMLTSSIDTKDVERAKAYRCVCDFISKPLNESSLLAVLQTKDTYCLRYR